MSWGEPGCPPGGSSAASDVYTGQTLDIDDIAMLTSNEALTATKEFFREAARLTRIELTLDNHSSTKVQFAAVLAVARAARLRDKRALRRAVLLAPHLAGFIDRCNGTITNPMAVRDSLHELMESALNEDLRALEVSMEPAVRKGPKRDMLRQRQALW